MNHLKLITLSPSILTADFLNLGEEIAAVDRAGAPYIHIDVMDGVFVPAISFGMPVLSAVRSVTDKILDVHLMIVQPERYIEEFARCGADIITFHLEACEAVEDTINRIHACGIRAGISISPDTPLEEALPYLPMAEMVLIMTVYPGKGGQKLIPSCKEKVSALRRIVTERGLDTDIEVDGGIKLDNLEEIAEAGANVVVVGSAVFEKGRTAENAAVFVERCRRGV